MLSEPAAVPPRPPRLKELAAPVLAGLPSREATARRLQARMRWYALWQVLDLAILMWAPWTALKVVTAIAFAMYRTRTI